MSNLIRYIYCGILVLVIYIVGMNLYWMVFPPTVEQDIQSVNRMIFPDGHLTKTHLYIHWPTVYTKPRRNDPGGKEIVPAVTLKIPLEYLANNLPYFQKVKFNAVLKKEPSKVDYYEILNVALAMDEHQITRVFLRLLPGEIKLNSSNKLISETDSSEKHDSNSITVINSFALNIHRNDYHALPLSSRKSNGNFYKPPDLSCLETTCFAHFDVRGRAAGIMGYGESLDDLRKAYSIGASKSNSKNLSNSSVNQLPSYVPKWHEKVNAAQALLNSFVLAEDSSEIKGMFPSPEQKRIPLFTLLLEQILPTEQIPKIMYGSSKNN